MKYLRELVTALTRQLSAIEGRIAVQTKRLSNMESEERPSIHKMEVAHDLDTQDEVERRDAMNDGELQIDLESQYGRTRWAKGLIGRILKLRKDRNSFHKPDMNSPKNGVS